MGACAAARAVRAWRRHRSRYCVDHCNSKSWQLLDCRFNHWRDLGIVLAVAGAGVWALVAQVLAQRLAELTIVWMSVPVRLSFKWSGVHFREMWSVGMNVFIARIVSFVGSQLPRVILGYTLGPTEVGLFALAGRFLEIILFVIVVPPSGVGRIELREFNPGSAEFGGSSPR